MTDIEQRFGGKRYFFERGDIRDFEKVKELFSQVRRHYRCPFCRGEPRGPVHFRTQGFRGDEHQRHVHAARSCPGAAGQEGRMSGSTISAPTKYTVRWARRALSSKRRPTTPEVPTPRQRRLRTIWSGPIFIPTVCRSPCPTARTITGPITFPEKLIPLTILNALEGKAASRSTATERTSATGSTWKTIAMPSGRSLHGERQGKPTISAASAKSRTSRSSARSATILDELVPAEYQQALKERTPGVTSYQDLITFVPDRPGHDRRYAINCDKIKNELGWRQKHNFEQGLRNTVVVVPEEHAPGWKASEAESIRPG